MSETTNNITTVKPSTNVPTDTSTSPNSNHVAFTSTAPRMPSGPSPASATETISGPSTGASTPERDSPAAWSSTTSSMYSPSPYSTMRSAGRSAHCTTITHERRKVIATAAIPTSEPPLGRRLPKNRISQKDVKVRAGMTHAFSSTPQPLIMSTSSMSTLVRLR